MEKQKLTYYEMRDLFHKYFFRGIKLFITALPLFLGAICSLLALPPGITWQTVGWITLTIAVSCIIAAISCFMIAAFWSRKAEEPAPWVKKAQEHWESRQSSR